MSIKRLFAITLISTALLGCATGTEEPNWRPYKDIDGETKAVSFVEETSVYEMDKPLEKRDLTAFQGHATRKSGDKLTQLGYLSVLINGNGNGMATIFNINGDSLNPHRKEDVDKLAKAKSFDFYEFGNFRLSHAKFSAKNNICKDFNGKNGVNLLMTTNYYPENSFTDFYTALIEVNLQSKQAPQEIGYNASFTGNDAKVQEQMKQDEQKHGKGVAVENIREKASILFNIICKG
ncbi:hypothetical protein [Lonepinella sp. MS14437]|uniref:hypothetical protein n=1 Tax=Lonepinella sp. MS14437 TaxID=3003620 RepID=UPI0036DC302D